MVKQLELNHGYYFFVIIHFIFLPKIRYYTILDISILEFEEHTDFKSVSCIRSTVFAVESVKKVVIKTFFVTVFGP